MNFKFPVIKVVWLALIMCALPGCRKFMSSPLSTPAYGTKIKLTSGIGVPNICEPGMRMSEILQKQDISSCYAVFKADPTREKLLKLLIACTESDDNMSMAIFNNELDSHKSALVSVDGVMLSNHDIAVACMSALSGIEIPNINVKCILAGTRFDTFYRYHILDVREENVQSIKQTFNKVFNCVLPRISPTVTITNVSIFAGDYSANALNQYTQRTVPGHAAVCGEVLTNATVTVNERPVWRSGSYFYGGDIADNTASNLWKEHGSICEGLANVYYLAVVKFWDSSFAGDQSWTELQKEAGEDCCCH